MKNKKLKFYCEVAVYAAIGIVFDLIAGIIPKFWPNGGSLSIAMLPVFLMGYRYKLKGSLLTGLIIGCVQLIYASYLLNFFQIMLDYVLAYTVVGFCSIFLYHIENKKIITKIIFSSLGVLLGVFLRLLLTTLSGYLFWETAWWPSFTYNLTYLLPSSILCLIIMIILINTLPNKYLYNN